MASKTLEKKVAAKPVISKFATPVVDSAKDILFAGLGAFSVAQSESGKLIGQGTKLFEKLVSEGAKLEKKSAGLAETAVDDLKNDVGSKFENVRQQATENWDNLGNIFDERVSGTLERLGIPTSKELNRLSGRVQKMSRQATNNWKEFESVFEKRVSAALNSLHVPGREDLNKLSDSVQKVSRDAAENLGKLENTFEKRVKEILAGLGLPSTDDINELSAGMQKLASQVTALEKQMKANAKLATPKPVAKKSALPVVASDQPETSKAESKDIPAS